jgi:5-amino-6-(5-phosphoribosylamino)uracil reductase/diaminohydroxyphosphoribosylaminopyrimidine deaminase/5-amino-6-(5-phosphoribosylamino)uracil reductase
MAQTLDGCIATRSGQSQWISSRADVVHSHRLRALHDAVMVGGNTLREDNPRLTVRRVHGSDPVRVLIGRAEEGDHADYRYTQLRGKTLILSRDVDREETAPASTDGREVRRVPVAAGGDGIVSPREIVSVLKDHGIRTLFIEGGGITVSHFVRERRIDLLHLLVAPITLGSGIRSIDLPPVDRIEDGMEWGMEHFDLGGEILFVLRPSHPHPDGNHAGPHRS